MPEQFEPLPSYEKRFGNIAIEKGFINSQQLMEALDIQVIGEIKDGKHHLIGQVLLKIDHMTSEQIEEVLDQIIKD